MKKQIKNTKQRMETMINYNVTITDNRVTLQTIKAGSPDPITTIEAHPSRLSDIIFRYIATRYAPRIDVVTLNGNPFKFEMEN